MRMENPVILNCYNKIISCQVGSMSSSMSFFSPTFSFEVILMTEIFGKMPRLLFSVFPMLHHACKSVDFFGDTI